MRLAIVYGREKDKESGVRWDHNGEGLSEEWFALEHAIKYDILRRNQLFTTKTSHPKYYTLIPDTSSHPSQGHPAARQENSQNTNQNIYQLIYKDSINVLTFGRCYMKMRSKEVGEGELFAWCFPGFDFCLEIYLATVLRCLYVPPLPRIFLEVMLAHSFMASTFQLDSEFNLIHQQALIAILLYSWPLLASL